MTDSKSKAIPQWQRQKDDKVNQQLREEEAEASPFSRPEIEQDRTALIEKAKEFLEHEDIRDATTDRKILFLEKKGLHDEEIQQLLGVSRIADASSPVDTTSKPDDSSISQPPAPNTSTISTPALVDANKPPQPQQVTRDAPPIITYPEFLLHAQRPAPLVTRQRLITTLYTSALAAAAIHTTSTYLVQPMIASLTEARHSLFGTAQTDLETLNEKLSGVVSTIPVAATLPTPHHPAEGAYTDSDDESEASDPSEMFHRDAGVQTSDLPSPGAEKTGEDGDGETKQQPAATVHSEKLRTLRAHLSSLNDDASSSGSSSGTGDKQRTEIAELQGYLEDLRFGSARLGKWDHTSGQWVGGVKDDEVSKVKAEIRSVKGVLLSARSFPAGGISAGRGR